MSTTGLVMTVTDELLAELEEAAKEAHIARSGNDWFSPEDCCWWTGNADEGDFISAANPATITALTAELRRLRAENAELAKDAGRYRYLKLIGRKDIVVRDRVCHLFQSNLDSAVDTAMATQ